MKQNSLKLFGLTVLLIVSFSLSSSGQQRAGTTPKTISAEDKRIIISMFKGVDGSLYRLKFNDEVYGSKKIEMRDLEQVKRVSDPLDAQGWVVISHSDLGIMSFVAVTRGSGTSLVSVLGKEKAAKLTAIMSKYSAEAIGE